MPVSQTVRVLAVASLVAGCAMQTPASRAVNDRVSSGTVVTSKELAGIAEQGTLFEALERIRPDWLRSRGATSGVRVDGGAPAELDLLRMIPTSTVSEVRFERASSGGVGHALVSANGDVIVGNLIIVTTLHGR